jgi:hypothetical protein
MGFFKRIGKALSGNSQAKNYAYWIVARCSRCGEIIQVKVDLHNDLSIDYGENGENQTYFCRKILMADSNRCFQHIEIELTFDLNRKLINRKIGGGEFVDE